MGGRQVPGHRCRPVPLAPTKPRQRTSEGWRAECICGWAAEPFPTKVAAERSYREHLISSAPQCIKCGKSKSHSEMSRHSPNTCKRCKTAATKAWAAANPKEWDRHRRKSHLRKQYNITPEEFDRILRDQGGVCAICGDPPGDSRGFRPHVDHCHSTGRVRGILCGRCNIGIGQFQDDPELVAKALAYLESHELKEDAA